MKQNFLKIHQLNAYKAFGYGAMAFALAFLPACSDDDLPDKGEGEDPEIEANTGVKINVVNDPTSLASRVTNFYQGITASRSTEGRSISITAAPAVPTDVKEFSQKMNGGAYLLDKSGSYALDMDNKSELFVNATGVTLSINSSNGKPNKIYILQGSEVTLDNTYGWKGVEVYAYGQINFSNRNEIKLIEEAALYIDGALGENLSGNNDENKNEWRPAITIDNNCKLVVSDQIYASTVSLLNGSVEAGYLQAQRIDQQNNVSVTVAGEVKITGKEGFKLAANTALTASCLEVPNGTLEIPNSSKINIDNYISVKNLTFNSSGAQLNMQAASFVDVAGTLRIENTNTGFSFPQGENDAYSLIRANIFEGPAQNGEIDLNGIITGKVYVKFNAIKDKANSSTEGVGIIPSALVETGTTTIPQNGCNPGFNASGKEPDPDDFTVIGQTSEHAHPISATCIDLYGNQAFVSWHRRGIGSGSGVHDKEDHNGDSFWGCIEVLDIKDDKLVVTSYMETEKEKEGEKTGVAYDFNHLIYDNATNSILTVGDNSKKGAIIGKIQLDASKNFGMGAGLDIMKVRHLLTGKGTSGNSLVMRESDRTLLMTTAGGYQTMSYTTEEPDLLFNPKKVVGPWLESAGSAKHVAVNSTHAVTIEFTSRSDNKYDEDDYTTQLEAIIKVWPIEKFVFNDDKKGYGNPTWEVKVPAFAPIYGKNVIAIDDDGTVYSCQGQNGVAIYKNGAEVGRFKVPDTGANGNKNAKAAANGLCLKGNYLYIAYGAAGVYVVDKTSLEVKAKCTKIKKIGVDGKEVPRASANYIQVTDNGYVYVAFGRAGVKLLKPIKDL